MLLSIRIFFFFNDTATTEIYTLSLHDALPILSHELRTPLNAVIGFAQQLRKNKRGVLGQDELAYLDRIQRAGDRKSTRLNSSHANISYAVFCLKKKKLFRSGNSTRKCC